MEATATTSAVRTSSANASPNDLTIAFTVAPSTPPPAGLVAAYSFNEASGSTVADSSGNNLNGSVNGATRCCDGQVRRRIVLQRDEQYHRHDQFCGPAEPDDRDDPGSVGLSDEPGKCVAQRPHQGAAERRGVRTCTANTDVSRPTAYIVRSSATGSPVTRAGRSGASTEYLEPPDRHLRQRDAALLRERHAGRHRAVTSGAMVTSTGAVRIGGNSLWGEYFAGMIDEVRIYNRALTAAKCCPIRRGQSRRSRRPAHRPCACRRISE